MYIVYAKKIHGRTVMFSFGWAPNSMFNDGNSCKLNHAVNMFFPFHVAGLLNLPTSTSHDSPGPSSGTC